ncbi:MAG: glycosyltransferase family 2 protein [Paludibacteraceae bacterium]|nr:glycosyltransferase family 2 protein [Paludibacteraceae bacterium]
MKILTIIVTYNGLQWYDRCFGSLQRSAIPLDIMVVDNASQDGTADWIAAHYPEINLIRLDKNLGFGQANNIGMRYALDNGYDYVFLLNQDAWLHTNDCIERLVQAAEKHPEYMIVSALWLYGSGERITKGSKEHMIAISRSNNDFVSDLYLDRELNEVYETDYIGAAAWLLPRNTLEKIGGFDPLFFHRGEDDNYMQRVHYHGGKIGLCAKACIYHDIEERPANYDAEHNNWNKDMLIELADINSGKSISQWKKQYLLQTLRQMIELRWRKMRRNLKIWHFIKTQQTIVEMSKNTNKTIGAHWL